MERLPVRTPFGSLWTLQRAVDRLFDDAFYRVGLGQTGEQRPALDLYETEDTVVVRAAVPGFAAEDIHVTLLGDTLTIKGEARSEREEENRNYIHRERRTASFQRSIALPHGVTGEAKAEFENGVLTLTLPKPEEVKPKTVQITAK